VKQSVAKFISIISCAAIVSSCEGFDSPTDTDAKKMAIIDADGSFTRDDFQKMRDVGALTKTPPEVKANLGNVVEPPIPDLAEILAAPPKPKIGESQLVSLAVTDDVPLKDVLLEVARLAKVDIDVDSSITGGISMRATDKPFNEVIERICNMGGLRYKMQNGVLRIERDTPYIKVYTLDLLNSDRSATGNISIGGGSGNGGSSGGSGSGTGSGSTASITAKTDSDFWVKFESSIAQILAFAPTQQTSATTIAAQPAPAVSQDGGSPAIAQPSPSPAPVAAAPAAPAASANGAPAGLAGTFYVTNKQVSTLTVSANEKQHDLVKKFIDKIQENSSSQVLIEAKVVEVTLSDTYQTGVNWSKFGGKNSTGDSAKGIGFTGNLANVLPINKDLTTPAINVVKNNILNSGLDLSMAVNMLEQFGTTRALSSPRLNAMNNQQAVLSFSQDLRYFEVKIDTTDAVIDSVTKSITTPAKVTVTSTPKISPVGIVLNLQPSINSETQEVTLNIRPTITRFLKNIPDPGFSVSKAAAISALSASTKDADTTTVKAINDVIETLRTTASDFPQLETKELDSIVKVKSGQTLVIGGLLEDSVANTNEGVPYASDIPIFGNLFKSVDKVTTKKELVIFIRATIVGSNGSADPYDKALYEKFIKDPRPLKF
jgi:general secretion pathway protein D